MSHPRDGQDEADEARPKDDGMGEADGADKSNWRETGEEFDSLRNKFRSSYQEGAGEGPAREEIIKAFRTLGGAISHIVSGAGNTLKDPEVKQQVKKATHSVVSAFSGLLEDIGAGLRSRLGNQDEQEKASPADPEPVPDHPADADEEDRPLDQNPADA